MAPSRSRRVITPKLNSSRARTPYDRPVNHPSTPNRQITNQGGTSSSSIFSRVKSLFTPSRLWNRQTRDNDQMEIEQETETPDKIFNFPPPVVPRPNLDQFNEFEQSRESTPVVTPSAGDPSGLGSSISPNQRLADFFKRKGDSQLSDVETEGVMSLIRQAATRNESLVEFERFPPTKRQRTGSDASEKSSPQRHYHSFASTPVRGDATSNEPLRHTPQYSPLVATPSSDRKTSANANANGARRSAESSFDEDSSFSHNFNSLPTPYRPGGGRFSPRNVHSPPVEQPRSTTASVSPPASEASTITNKNESAPERKKPLSQTATTLLSLISSPEEEEAKKKQKEEEQKNKDVAEFINPYASTPRRAGAKRSMSKLKRTPQPQPQQRQLPQSQSQSRAQPQQPQQPQGPPKSQTQPTTTPTTTSTTNTATNATTTTKSPTDQAQKVPEFVSELQRTMPKELASPSIEKYTHKPARSSNLRQSMVASPEGTPQKESAVKPFVFQSPGANPPKPSTDDPAQKLYPDASSSLYPSTVGFGKPSESESEKPSAPLVSPAKPLMAPTPQANSQNSNLASVTPFQFGKTAPKPVEQPKQPEKQAQPEKPVFTFGKNLTSTTSESTAPVAKQAFTPTPIAPQEADDLQSLFQFPKPSSIVSNVEIYDTAEFNRLKNDVFKF